MTAPGVYPDLAVFAIGLEQGVTIRPEDWRCCICHAPALPLKRRHPHARKGRHALACGHRLPVDQPYPVNRYTARYLIGQHILALLGLPPARPVVTRS